MPSKDTQLPEHVRDALERGQTIEAIKLMRESSGLDLKEAKDLIDAYKRGQSGTLSDAASVAEALQQGNKIEAVRRLRKQTGLGLKEAKETIDALQNGSSVQPGQGFNRDASDPRTFPWWLVGAALAGLAIYLMIN